MYQSQRALTDGSSKESQGKQRILKVMSAVSMVTGTLNVTATLNYAVVGFTLSQATKALRESSGIAQFYFRPVH